MVNPATGDVISHVAHATQADVDTAVAAARRAFKTTWGTNVSGTTRGKSTSIPYTPVSFNL